MLLQTFENIGVTANTVTWVGFFGNLVPVILGNIIGGSVLVGWCITSSIDGRQAGIEMPDSRINADCQLRCASARPIRDVRGP